MNGVGMNVMTLASDPIWKVGKGLWFNEEASTFAPKSDSLYMFIFWVSTFFFFLVIGLMTSFVFKYRRRIGVPAQRSVTHNTPLELTWTFVPMLFLAVMFVWGFRDYMYMHVAPAGAEEIHIRGQQWSWQATYDNGASPTETMVVANQKVPIIPVPKGRPVRVLLDSIDVLHSFWVPDFRIKIDVMPNRYTSAWFEATSDLETHIDSEGNQVQYKDHYLFCAEYCGDLHSQMAAIIRVMPDSQYQAVKATFANIFDRTPAEAGEILYNTKGCVACHSTTSASGTGPGWAGVFGSTERVRLPNGQVIDQVVDENYLRESILVPGAKIVDGYANQMTPYQGLLTEQELHALIEFIKSLGVNGGQGGE